MRTLADVDADLKALRRPIHPGCAGSIDPRALARWRSELEAWRAAHPSGDAAYEALLAEETAMLKARAAGRRAHELTRGVLPPRVAKALLALKPTGAIGQAERWAGVKLPYLVLGGDVGAGKSVAAGHALSCCMAQGMGGAWVSSAGFATLAGGFRAVEEAERLRHIDVLVVDDFGTEHLSEFAESVFFEVMAARHENETRTIFTHNLTRENFRKRLGSRLADRIATACVYVECAGPSMRGDAVKSNEPSMRGSR